MELALLSSAQGEQANSPRGFTLIYYFSCFPPPGWRLLTYLSHSQRDFAMFVKIADYTHFSL